MPSASTVFLQDLGSRISEALGSDFKYRKSRLEFRKVFEGGEDVVSLAGSNRFSPHISVSFYFACSFAAAHCLEELVGLDPLPYHIQQLSLNRGRMKGLTVRNSGREEWSINIEKSIDPRLVAEIIAAIHGMAFPFFDRFSNILSARDALSSNDSWCLGGKMAWRQLLILDGCLNDLVHFRKWSSVLGDLQLGQAMSLLSKVESAIPLKA
jgi:hypothetical protein